MNDFEFDFNIGHNIQDIPTVSLIASGLSFNRHAIAALGCPAYIAIGLDRQNKKLAVKPTDKAGFCPRYRFVTNEERKNWIVVSSVKICEEVFNLLNIRPRRNGIKFPAAFDKDSNMLIADLTQVLK